jgi:signal transduction histidine kinase
MFLKHQINNLAPIFFGIRARLTAMFVLIFGTTTVVFSIFLYYFLDQSLLKDFDDSLYNYSVDVSQTIEIGQNNSLTLPPLKVDEGKIYPFQSGNTLFLIRHISGEILSYGSNSKKFNPRYKDQFKEILAGADSAYHTTTNVHTDAPEAISYRTITFPLDNDVNPTLFLQIAAPMGTFETQLDQMKVILLFGLPAILLIAIISGLYLSARALRPVQDMIDKTNNINASKLDERVALPESKDEIKKLAETINLMLERIEIAFQSQEKFISNASHQLLTPITILKGEVELEMKHENNPAKKTFYSSILQEIDSLTGIINSMLLLAKIDSGKNILNLVDSHPAELILDLLPRMQKLAEQKKIKIKLDIIENGERVPCKIDEELMEQLFSNLIENAIKYSFEEGTILIRVFWNTGSTRIEIEDFGRGVALAARKDIFSHFSRADTSSKIKGYGLGLSIAQKIAQLHATEIVLEDKAPPGALFSIKLNRSQV